MTAAEVRPEPAKAAADLAPVLELRALTTAFPTTTGLAIAVNNVSFAVRAGETKGIVGESGSGKSMTCRSILGLVPWPGKTVSGSIIWKGRELLGLHERDLRRIRGSEIAMVFQDPASALNPVLTVGEQISELLRVRQGFTHRAAGRESVALLTRVGIASPERRVKAYPHELSGGMRQRVMIALALSCRPQLILADEPTTALDVTIQGQILNLLSGLQAEYGMSLVLVSHDLGVVAQYADSVAVMYAGHVVEDAPTREILERHRHPYTEGLVRAVPTLRPSDLREPLVPIPGQPPALDTLPAGCPFQPRCPYRRDGCEEVSMELMTLSTGHESACPFDPLGKGPA
jgi:oligopeptide/dipeptide ABC transporter ATP-binding protein